jgi:hypothetical protein
VLNECTGCGTLYAHDLRVCPHCGEPLQVPQPASVKPARGKPMFVGESGPELVHVEGGE